MEEKLAKEEKNGERKAGLTTDRRRREYKEA